MVKVVSTPFVFWLSTPHSEILYVDAYNGHLYKKIITKKLRLRKKLLPSAWSYRKL